MGFSHSASFWCFLLATAPWSPNCIPILEAQSLMERLNISLPVKQSRAQGYSRVGQYLISILWWVGPSKAQMPMQDMLDQVPEGEGNTKWSVRKLCLQSSSTRSISSFFSQMWSLRAMRISMSPHRGRPLRQDPHTSRWQLSMLSTSFQKICRTNAQILVIFSLGILINISQKYLSPIFWFLLSSQVLPLSSSMDLTPFQYSS